MSGVDGEPLPRAPRRRRVPLAAPRPAPHTAADAANAAADAPAVTATTGPATAAEAAPVRADAAGGAAAAGAGGAGRRWWELDVVRRTAAMAGARRRIVLGAAAVLLVVGVVAAIVVGDEPAVVETVAPATTTTVATTTTTTTTTLPPTTTTAPPPPVTEPPPPPPPPTEPPPPPATEARPAVVPIGVVQTPTGLLVPVISDLGGGTYEVQTPCDDRATIAATPIGPVDVVLDPGHGGSEPGAVGPNGLREKDLNLAVAQQVATQLRSAGLRVVLTRDVDVRLTLAHRANIAVGLHATFLSIHHNAAPDGPSAGPGTEVYFQVANPESRRLAGLVVEETRAALAPFAVAWASDADNGARARIRSSDGTDFYGVLRRTAGVTGVLSEAGYLSNPAEADLFATAEGQAAEAGGIARAVRRWFAGEGAGPEAFSPNPPSTGASGGPGGGPEGCVDPPLQ